MESNAVQVLQNVKRYQCMLRKIKHIDLNKYRVYPIDLTQEQVMRLLRWLMLNITDQDLKRYITMTEYMRKPVFMIKTGMSMVGLIQQESPEMPLRGILAKKIRKSSVQ